MRREGNTIYFANDQEFYDFAVSPFDVFRRMEGGTLFYDWNFTPAYEGALAEGKEFVIEDPNSQVVKHQCAVYRTVCKQVEHVKGLSKLHKKS
jgi:hypothetical protein